jgi:hypothetical protein
MIYEFSFCPLAEIAVELLAFLQQQGATIAVRSLFRGSFVKYLLYISGYRDSHGLLFISISAATTKVEYMS